VKWRQEPTGGTTARLRLLDRRFRWSARRRDFRCLVADRRPTGNVTFSYVVTGSGSLPTTLGTEVLSSGTASLTMLCRISRFIKFSRVQHLGEVCPLSRSVMWSVERTQPISAPLQSSICFLSNLLPAPPSILLTVDLSPVLPGRDTGLSCSVEVT
jgi:hypothetical protein